MSWCSVQLPVPVFLSERRSSSEPPEEEEEETRPEPVEEEGMRPEPVEEVNLCPDEDAEGQEGDETTVRQVGEELKEQETEETLPLLGEESLPPAAPIKIQIFSDPL